MNKYLLKVLTTPSCWLNNFKTDARAEKFYRTLLDHKDEVKVTELDNYEMTLTFRGKEYEIWIANRYYACLQNVSYTDKDGHWKNAGNFLPTRATMLEFMETFYEPSLPPPEPDPADVLLETLEAQ